MKYKTKLDDYKHQVDDLESQVSTQQTENSQIINEKDVSLRKVTKECQKLEVELIDAKMEAAYLKSKLEST